MKYPEFLKKDDLIMVCAPSEGVQDKIPVYEVSLDVLKQEGYRIVETDSVRNGGYRSGDIETRVKELHTCFQNPEAKLVYCARGGEFMDEIVPYVDFEMMKDNPKWLCGASDPTNLLYPYTVKYDVATLYGFNAGAYDENKYFPFIQDNLKMLKGEDVIQHSSELYASLKPWEADRLVLDAPSTMFASQPSLAVSGRAIGGCIDVLSYLLATPADGTTAFIEKYKEDGFIWFFDNFALSVENFYHTLLQMKRAGWFAHTKAVVLGRTIFPSSHTDMTYEQALSLVFKDVPYIVDADIGHTEPCMTLMLGAVAHLNYQDNQMSLSFERKA